MSPKRYTPEPTKKSTREKSYVPPICSRLTISSKHYEFEPLEESIEINFSDNSNLTLPRRTYVVAYEIINLNQEEKKLHVYPKLKPEQGLGVFKFHLSVLGELEEKIKELGGKLKKVS
ncbi:hypothetical protein KY308_00720 [Candidatus Woesearchaeota archaeon]|nr:hypothetical protein [Candidatus Woesearchaeota archaeon]